MAHHDSIPLARPGPVDNRQLRSLRDYAYAAYRGDNLTDAECVALLSAMGPLFDELLLRREACRTITGDSNIILLDQHRASLADA
ncbi:hypothetical protein [Oceanicola sp. S124]|uniref:hypothetical protein n=1 Tax=Oceanicola sp. S124 TaxID=1042378 RepID=UPI0002559EF8|nr:hypothetical protein [Oceanicola sp. S124]